MNNFHDFTQRAIDGSTLDLRSFAGKAVLVVNVASRCGLTPQYAGLEALHRELSARGLVVLGVPANEFGAQEPGTEAEIASFCSAKYDVTFPMLAKCVVKGDGQAPLYQWLTSTATPSGDITWNFEKFLIARDGTIAGRFQPTVKPESEELRRAIDAVL